MESSEKEIEDVEKKNNSVKKVAINLVLFFISLLFILIISEILLRVFFPVTDTLYTGDEIIGFKHIPNWSGINVVPESITKVKFNSEGFRDDEHIIANPDKKYRIVFLGDSYVDALQVDFEKTFHQIVEKRLEEKYPGKFEVFNFGMPSFSTGQELLTYESYAKKYNPDLIYLFFFMNDPYDNCCIDSTKPCFYKDNSGIKQRPFQAKNHSKLSFFIAKYFKIPIFLRTVYYQVRKKLDRSNEKKIGIIDYEKVFLKEYDNQTKDCWDITHYLFKRFEQETNSSNVKFKVFIIPHPASIYDVDKQKLLKEDTSYNESFLDFDKPQKEIKKILESERIQYVDLTKALKNPDNRTYLEFDYHFNNLGHEVVADVIIDELKKDNVI